ncbi:MAG: 30S ribosomal protein S17 [Solirubrobacteraceae bacterium]|jgi:small subunit ribosomal protein S17
MADDPDNDTPETEQDAPEAAAGEPVQADATAEAAGGEPKEADATEAEQAPVADADAEADAVAEDVAPPAAPAPPAEPVEQISSKERRRRARSKHTEARPSRSPEERHAERLAERKTKAIRRRARRLQERAKAAERRASSPAPEPIAPVHPHVEGTRMVRQGVVVSDKAEKTITVRIDVARRHRRYEKIVRSSNTVHAHDENNDAHEGDVVRVIESRPLSRTKRWALVDVLERAR